MTSLSHILRRAARRDFAGRALMHAGRGLAWATATALALLLADRTIGLSLYDSVFIVFPIIGLLAGIVFTVWSRPSRHELAVKLDRELALKDRVGTAHALLGVTLPSEQSNAFAQLLQSDAQRVIDGLDIRRATPIRISGIWGIGLGLALMLWLGAIYMPSLPLVDRDSESAPHAVNNAAVQQDGQKVAEVLANAIAQLPRDPSQDSRIQEELAAIDRLAQQMSNAQSPEELDKAREDSAARLTDVAEQLSEQAREELASAQEVAQRFAGMDSTGAPKPPMSAQQFSEALKRGDFAQASDELQRLLRDADQLPPQDRQALADSLRHASERLQEGGEADQQQTDERREQLAQALADQGLDKEAIDRLLQPRGEPSSSTPQTEASSQEPESAASTQPQRQDEQPNSAPPSTDEIERTLRERGVDEDVARKLARDLDEHNREQRLQQKTEQDVDEVSQSFNEAAEQIREHRKVSDSQPQQTPSASTQPDNSDSTSQPRQDSKPSAQPLPATAPDQAHTQNVNESHKDATRDSPPQAQPKQAPDEGEQAPSPQSTPATQPDGQPSADPGKQESPPRSQQNQPQQPGAQSQQDSTSQQAPSEQSQGVQPQPGQEQSRQSKADENTSTQSEQRESSTDQTQQEGSQRQPGQQPTQNQKPQAGQDQSSQPDQSLPQNFPAPTPDAVKALKELAERQSTADQRQQLSERLRKTAQDLARNMTPQQREEWARQWQREMGDLENQQSPQQPSPDDALGRASNPESDSMVGDETSSAEMSKPDHSLAGSATEDVDLRKDDTGDRVIAQWLDDTDPGGPQGTATSSASQRIVQAQSAAERAVNDAAVPPRYHNFIKRVFGRLNQTTKEAARGASSPAPSDTGDKATSGGGM